MAYEAIDDALRDQDFVATAAELFVKLGGSQHLLLDGVLAAGVSPDAAPEVTVSISTNPAMQPYRRSAGDFTVGYAVGMLDPFLNPDQGVSNG